jgi:hypothetical protein
MIASSISFMGDANWKQKRLQIIKPSSILIKIDQVMKVQVACMNLIKNKHAS